MVDLPAPPVVHRRVAPALALVLVILGVLFGGYVTAAFLSEPAGPLVDVAGVVRVEPLSGWAVAGRSGSPPAVRLTRGGGTLDVAALPFDGAAEALLRSYVAEVLEPQASQLSVSSVEPTTLRSGQGVRIGYISTVGDVQTPVEGEVTAFVSASGVGVVFDGWAPTGLLGFVVDDIQTMIERAEVA